MIVHCETCFPVLTCVASPIKPCTELSAGVELDGQCVV